MNEAVGPFLSYGLRPQETEGDGPQFIAERGGEFPRIENDADNCLVSCQISLEPSHIVEILFLKSRFGFDLNAK